MRLDLRSDVMKTTWRKLIDVEMRFREDKEVASTLTPKQESQGFRQDYGEGGYPSFTVWGEKNVYFPLEYDGYMSVGFAPRNPCDIKMPPQ